MTIFLLIFLCFAEDFSTWAAKQRNEPIPESNYHTLADMYSRIAVLEREKPGVLESVPIGITGGKRTIWGFRIQEPARDIRVKVLVFAGLHPLEWISNETAMALIEELFAHPINHVSVMVIPCVNVDRRLLTEKELRRGDKKYRRSIFVKSLFFKIGFHHRIHPCDIRKVSKLRVNTNRRSPT